MARKVEQPKIKKHLRLIVCTPSTGRSIALTAFVETMKKQTEQDFALVNDFMGISENIEAVDGAVVVMSVNGRDELMGALQFLALNESKIVTGRLRIMALGAGDQPRILSLLKAKGVHEALDFGVTLKALNHKIKQSILFLAQALESGAKGDASQKYSQSKSNAAQKVASNEVKWLEPTEHFSDYWMILNPKHARFAIGKWLINFYGPGPSVGIWEDAGFERNGERGWKFSPRNGDDPTFFKTEGRWIFFGNCPEFSWEMKYWYFSARKPYFAFYENGQVTHEKAGMPETNELMLRRNSDVSRGLMDQIQNTIEASILLQNDHYKTKTGTVANDAESSGFDYADQKQKAAEVRARAAFERTEVSLAISSKNGEKLRIEEGVELVELRDQQAVLTIPSHFLEKGDLIELEANFKRGKSYTRISFSAKTKVIESEEDFSATETRAAAVCELDEKVQGQFDELVEVFQERRLELLEFFTKAKGA